MFLTASLTPNRFRRAIERPGSVAGRGRGARVPESASRTRPEFEKDVDGLTDRTFGELVAETTARTLTVERMTDTEL